MENSPVLFIASCNSLTEYESSSWLLAKCEKIFSTFLAMFLYLLKG
ncbi:hypothetical protein [Ehrlichia chaffeensis]|nr:hypothetical protein [Ehrlichia chaffeensis]AHX09495.1 hypothetical protein ECHWAK_0075 [Ehrlichia chaffeensis str. Wakulla]